MQTDKYQPEGERIMPFIEFPALTVDPRVGISRSVPKTDDRLFLLPIIGNIIVFITIVLLIPFIFYNLRCMTTSSERHSEFFVTAHKGRL